MKDIETQINELVMEYLKASTELEEKFKAKYEKLASKRKEANLGSG